MGKPLTLHDRIRLDAERLQVGKRIGIASDATADPALIGIAIGGLSMVIEVDKAEYHLDKVMVAIAQA